MSVRITSIDNATIKDPILKDNSTSYALTVPTLTQNTTIATAKDLTGYAAKSHTHSQYLTQHQSLTNYATKTGTETLSNKTLYNPVFTVSRDDQGTSTGTIYFAIPDTEDTVVLLSMLNNTLNDYLPKTNLNTEMSKYVPIEGSVTIKDVKTFWREPKLHTNSILTNTEKTIQFPEVNGTVALQSWVEAKNYLTQHQSLTNYVTLTDTQGLRNKTLFAPEIRDSTGNYALLLPTLTTSETIATQELLAANYVNITGTQTLTNKTLTSPTINTPTITNGTITTPIIKNPTLKDSSSSYALTVPTLTTNTTIATANDLESYSTTSHNHDGVYAAANHTHSQYLTEHQSLANYATKDEIPNVQFMQAAMCLLGTYSPYPPTFIPIRRKLNFTGWDNVTWTVTDFTTFLDNFSTQTMIKTPNGVSLTEVTNAKIKERLSTTNPTSIIFGTTKMNAPATSCWGMFRQCNKIVSLDLFLFDTTNVSIMGYMFSDCGALETLDVSNFNTSNVTDMRSMFATCNALTTLTLSSFNTSKVTDMSNMFATCKALTALTLSSFNTSKVTTMMYMFATCNALETLDLSSFDTSNVTTMMSMFQNCTSLTTLNLSNFSATTKLTNANMMFTGCTALTTLICTKAFLDKIISKSCGITDPSNIRNTISDTAAHTWTIANLAVTAVV